MLKNIDRGLSRAIAMFLVLSVVRLYAAKPNSVSVEISSGRSSIRLGEPIIIKMVYRFKEPYVNRLTGKIPLELSHMMRYEVQTKDGRIQEGIYPAHLLLQDEAGLEYGGALMVWHSSVTGRLEFTEPGQYILRVYSFIEGHPSNDLGIVVAEPGPLEKQALSILTDPNDLVFVKCGLCNTPRTVSKLEQVVDKCKGSIIAQLCAARLGIATCTQIDKIAEQGQLMSAESSALVNGLAKKANGFLAMAAGLPDEFPIREEVMYRYSETQALLGNLKQVVSICEEILAKYPRGKKIDIVRATLSEVEEMLRDKKAGREDK